MSVCRNERVFFLTLVIAEPLFYSNTFSCPLRRPAKYSAEVLRAHGAHLSDAVHSIPPKLLASLLHEELEEQRERALFFQGATGGALAFVPFGDSGCRSGCLLYPGSKGLDCLSILCVSSDAFPALGVR